MNFCRRHAGATVTLFFIVTVLLGVALKDSRLELDIYDVFDENFQSSVDHAEIKDFYSDRTQMLVSFKFAAAPTAREICTLLKWSKDLSNYEEVKGVTSLWSVRTPKLEGSRLWYPKSLHDPCSLPADSLVSLSELKDSFFRHLLARTDSKDIVFDVSFSGKDSDTKQVDYVIKYTDNFISVNLPGVTARYLGPGSSRYYFKKIMFKDSVYNLLVVIIILLFMRVVFGTWISGFLLSLTLIMGNVILYGLMAVMGLPIDILTNNLFLMTAVAATADFIFVSQAQMVGPYEESLNKYVVPCFFTTLTTFLGFLSLNTSDLNIIKGFGNGAAIGALVEWIIMFLFVPSLLRLLKREKAWVNPEKSLKLQWLSKLENVALPKVALVILVLLMILSVPSFFFLNDQDSPVENLPQNHVMREAYRDFKKNFGWEGQVYLYFPDKLWQSEVKSITDEISKIPMVQRVETPYGLLEEWTEGLSILKQDLVQRELSLTTLWSRYFSDMDTLRIPLYLQEQDLHSLRKFRDLITPICKDRCRLAGQRVVYLEYGERISKTMIESFAVSILLVIFVLGCLLWNQKKFSAFVPVTVSSLIGPLVLLSLIAIFQIPVTLITSIFLAVMVGMAGDNAIQFLMAENEDLETGIKTRSRASIIVTIVMVLGSSMFILQTLKPMKILGGLFIAGFITNLLGDIWGLKGLLSTKKNQ